MKTIFLLVRAWYRVKNKTEWEDRKKESLWYFDPLVIALSEPCTQCIHREIIYSYWDLVRSHLCSCWDRALELTSLLGGHGTIPKRARWGTDQKLTDVQMPTEGSKGTFIFLSVFPCLTSISCVISTKCSASTCLYFNYRSIFKNRLNPYSSKDCLHVRRGHLPAKNPEPRFVKTDIILKFWSSKVSKLFWTIFLVSLEELNIVEIAYKEDMHTFLEVPGY